MRTPALARFVLLGAGIAMLVACLVEGRVATLAGIFAVAAFPPALMLLPSRSPTPPVWIVMLALSLAGGMGVVSFWSGSAVVLGLPLATWLTWLLLGAIPFVLVVYGVVVQDEER